MKSCYSIDFFLVERSVINMVGLIINFDDFLIEKLGLYFHILKNRVDNFIIKNKFIYQVINKLIMKKFYKLETTVAFFCNMTFNKYVIVYAKRNIIF